MSEGIAQRQGSQDLGTMQSQLAVEQESVRNTFLHTLVRVRGTSFGFGGAIQALPATRISQRGQSVGRSQGQIRVAQRKRGRL